MTPATGTGTYTPRPKAAPLPRMIAAQAALETRMLLRNGEQLLLTVVIPTLLLVLFSSVDIVDTVGRTAMGKLNKRALRAPYWEGARTIGG